MNFNPYTTGDGVSDEIACFLFYVPRSDWFKQAVVGALSELAHASNWLKIGTTTDIEAAQEGAKTVEGIRVLDFNPLPEGRIDAFAGETIPDGWLLCDGAEYDQTAYPELFAAIAQVWGGSTGTFRVPDLKGRVQIGVSGTHDLATTGGEETHVLTVGEMASHTHGYSTPDVPTLVIAPGEEPIPAFDFFPSSTDATGSDNPHNNMQPFAAVNMIIYAGR